MREMRDERRASRRKKAERSGAASSVSVGTCQTFPSEAPHGCRAARRRPRQCLSGHASRPAPRRPRTPGSATRQAVAIAHLSFIFQYISYYGHRMGDIIFIHSKNGLGRAAGALRGGYKGRASPRHSASMPLD